MQNDLYKLILKQLNFFKRDPQFEPNLLDKLSDRERIDIERKLYDLCIRGTVSAFKYIPYMINIDINPLFDEENLLRYNKMAKYELCKYGYIALKKKSILEELSNDSLKDVNAYKVFIDLYLLNKNDDILDILKRNATNETLPLLNERVLSKEINNMQENNDYKEKNYNEYDRFIFTDLNGKEISKSDMQKFVQEYNENKKNEIISSFVLNGVIGFAIGDALGVPVEFNSKSYFKTNPVRDMLEYGTHNQPKGTWSDDTSTMIAVMDSIIKSKNIDFDDMMERFCDWYNNAEYTATGKLFDIGIATSQSIANFMYGKKAIECGPKEFRQNGNGSLMRMFPIACYCICNNLTEEEEVDLINNYSSMTHGHEISKLGCKIYSDYIKFLFNTGSKEEAYKKICEKDYSKYYSGDAINEYKRILNSDILKYNSDEIRGSGYVVHSLEASIWCTLNSNSYEEAVLKSINLGEDTDTVGAITGSINGVIYGLPSIKNEWKRDLKRVDYLYNLSEDYSNYLILNKKKDKVR